MPSFSSCCFMATGIAAGTRFVLGNSTPHTAGIFCGSLTNTPALAAVMQTIRSQTTDEAERVAAVALPVVGYSLAYPFGVLGMIAAMAVTRRFWKVDDAAESAAAASSGRGHWRQPPHQSHHPGHEPPGRRPQSRRACKNTPESTSSSGA